MENAETQERLQFAMQSEYLDHREFKTSAGRSREIGHMLYYMIKYPDRFQDGNG